MEEIQRVLRKHPGLLHVTIGHVGSLAFGAIFWLVLARILLPDAYGQVNWLISIAMLASTFCVQGWGRTVTTYYPKEKKDELIGGSVGMVLAVSLAVGIAMGLLVEPVVGLLIIALSLFAMTLSVELGRRRYSRYKWILLGAKLTILPLAVMMYFRFGLFGILLGYAFPLLIFDFSLLRNLHAFNPGLSEIREKLNFSLKAFCVEASRGSTTLLDKILIGGVFGMATLGLYQLAYQVFWVLNALPVLLFDYLLPEKSAGTETREVKILGILISIALAATVSISAPMVIPRMFPNFAGSIKLVQIMSLGVIPLTIAMIRMSDFYAKERLGSVLVSYLVAVAVGMTGILVLGTYLGGIGLAMSVVLLQSALAVMLLLFIRE